MNFIGGLGGDDISAEQIERAFEKLSQAVRADAAPSDRVLFLGIDDVDGGSGCGGSVEEVAR